jgi:hypothetical protein
MGALNKWMTFRPWQRHSLVLAVGGTVYVAIGASFMGMGSNITEERRETIVLALYIAPIEFWGAVFFAAGVLAILSSKWPSFSDSWGYSVLTGVSGAWSAMYLAGYLFGPAPGTNITFALVWGMVSFMWWAISGLINPEKIVKLVDADEVA